MSLRVTQSYRIPQDFPFDMWHTILSRQDHYSFFQTPAWSGILCDVIPHARPDHRVFEFSDGTRAVLPLLSLKKMGGMKKYESLPWGSYGGYLSFSTLTNEHIHLATRHLISLTKPICEITWPPGRQVDEISNAPPFILSTHVAQCRSAEELWSVIQPRTRTDIRKGEKSGIQITWDNGRVCTEIAHHLYQAACRRWQGVETVPARFFQAITDADGQGIRVWLAWQSNHPLAMNIMLYGKGETQYFLGAGSQERPNAHASKVLMFHIMLDAVERGYTIINFGGSAGLEGVKRFKRHFGGREKNYIRLRFLHPWLNILRG